MRGFNNNFFICLWVLFLAYNSTAAQNHLNPYKHLDQYIYDHWTSEDGLPVNSVIDIIQAKNGYIWFVSYGGITRFNGIEFYTYSSFNTPEIQNNSFTHLYEGLDGTIWASSSGAGITAIKGDKITIYNVNDGLPGNFIEAVVQDNNGRLWVATSNGLYYKKGNRFTNEQIPELLKDKKLSSIECDDENNLWVGTGNDGVYKLQNNKIIAHHTVESGLSSNIINYIKYDKNRIWIGTNEGLSILDGNQITIENVNSGLQNNNITSSVIDDNNIIWVGSYRGFTRINSGKYSYFSQSHPLFEQDITSTLLDNEGNLWLGTYRDGLYKLLDGKFTNYTGSQEADQKPYVVHSILEKKPDELLIIYQEGVSVLNPKTNTLKPLALGEHAITTNIKSGFLDSKGNLWISTLNYLLKYKDGTSRIYDKSDGLVHDNVRLVFEDSMKNLWIGTTNGISVITDSGIKNYTVEDGLSHEYIMSFWEDSLGRMWIGTRNGLNVLENDKFTTYNASDGLAGDFIFRTFEDKDGTMWVCGNAGLTRYKNGKFSKILAINGLASNTIFQILEDDEGYFWFTTNQKGVSLFKVNKEALNAFSDGTIKKVNSIEYSKDDGLKATTATSSAQSLKASDGTLWFATNMGVEMIDPSNIKLNKQEPPVIIEKVIIDGKSFSFDSLVTIPAGKHRLTIQFAGLSYIAPKSINYKYQLAGYDDRWEDINHNREISYTNLPYGNYKFKIVAANGDGVWNEQGASLAFHIKPSFYETRIFMIIIALGTILIGVSAYQWRISSLKSARIHLAKEVAARTSKILNQKEEIEAQKEAIEEQQKQIEEKNVQLQKINLHLEDIVEERTEQLKIAYQELLKVNNELDTFIYRSVHDVRGPIARLQGLSNIISLETKDAHILKLVEMLRDTAEEMNDVFYRLLNIVRLRASELNIHEICITEVIDPLLEKFQNEYGCKTKLNLQISKDFQLFSDKEIVENVFYQLLDNAFKFKLPNTNPQLDISCSRTSMDFVCITVTDYGIGIPREISGNVFEMFFVGNDEIRGAGLGLYTVKTAVRVLNGKIKLITGNGKTTFEVILPSNVR